MGQSEDPDLRLTADRCVRFILEGLPPDQAKIVDDNLGRLAGAIEALGPGATNDDILAYARQQVVAVAP